MTVTTCPDWRPLLEPAALSTERELLKQHVKACRRCRKDALSADPLLAFRLVAPVEVDANEVKDMQGAVRTLRRAALAQAADSRGGWRGRAAMAAVFAVFALLMPISLRVHEEPAAMAFETLDVPATLPLIEGVSPGRARVYELRGDGLSVVMIVDDSLDLDNLPPSRS